jgi:hypothetical protein
MAISYPSIVVNLRLRFDETLEVTDMPEPLPQSGELVDAVSQPTGPTTRPAFLKSPGDNLSHIFNRVPAQAQVTLPGFRKAGQFQFKFDYRELPIDPRLARAIGVEIFQGTVVEGDFATGMSRVEPDGTRRSILNVFTADGDAIAEDKLIMAGVVDTWKMTHDEKGSWVEMEGRDLRGIFLDSPLDLRVFDKIDLKQPIDKVIVAILESHPAAEEMQVNYFEEEWPASLRRDTQGDLLLPSPADKDGLTRPRRKCSGKGAQVSTQSNGPNYWDMITRLTELVGGIPYFEGRNLFIRPARGIFSQIKNVLGNSVFRAPGTQTAVGREDELGQEFYTRKMIWGRNIASLAFERKYTGVKVPVIEVVSLDTSGKTRGPGKLLIQQWPPKDKALARYGGVSPSGESVQTEVLRINKPGIRDKARLVEIAKDLYEEIGRQEMGGVCMTKSVASFGVPFGNENAEPDMLRLKPGDAVEFTVDIGKLNSRNPIASMFTDNSRQQFEERVESIKRAMLNKAGAADENLIRAIVATNRSEIVEFMNFFRVANVRYNWNNGAVQIQFDFQNYILVRAGVTPPTLPPVKKKRKAVRRKVAAKVTRPTPAPEPSKPPPSENQARRYLNRSGLVPAPGTTNTVGEQLFGGLLGGIDSSKLKL